MGTQRRDADTSPCSCRSLFSNRVDNPSPVPYKPRPHGPRPYCGRQASAKLAGATLSEITREPFPHQRDAAQPSPISGRGGVWPSPRGPDPRDHQFKSDRPDHPTYMRARLSSCRVREMSPIEAAWLAGFIDGEGTISSYMGGRKRQFVSWLISVPNTSRSSLEYCQKITGTGSVLVKPIGREKRQPCHQWRVYRKRDIASVCRQILPHAVIKAPQIAAFFRANPDL